MNMIPLVEDENMKLEKLDCKACKADEALLVNRSTKTRQAGRTLNKSIHRNKEVIKCVMIISLS